MNENKNNNAMPDEGEYVYKTVMDGKAPTRLWSVISVTLSVIALALCFLGWWGIGFSVLGLAMAIVSRKSLGYFDKITLTSIIVSIFATVFSVAVLIFNSISF
jgi:hypothetical protein